MANTCVSCGGRGEWQEKHTRTYQVQDAKTKEWRTEQGDVWVDVRCSSCKGSGIK